MATLTPIRPAPGAEPVVDPDAVEGIRHPVLLGRCAEPAVPATCPACGTRHPDELTGGGEAELVAALRAGCPVAAELLVDAVTARVLAAGLSADGADELVGRCWLLLAQWPATGQDIIAAVATRLSRELDGEASRTAHLLALPTLDAHPGSPDEPDPDPAPASALVGRAVRLGLLSRGQARLLERVHVEGLTSTEVAAIEGRSPEAVRACCHRAVRRLRASRELLVDELTTTPQWPILPRRVFASPRAA